MVNLLYDYLYLYYVKTKREEREVGNTDLREVGNTGPPPAKNIEIERQRKYLSLPKKAAKKAADMHHDVRWYTI
jgi:hypothetical protein